MTSSSPPALALALAGDMGQRCGRSFLEINGERHTRGANGREEHRKRHADLEG